MHLLRTEKEIIDSWQTEVNDPIISICCITFNHASYISDAIEGFLIQKTNFPIEIIIHDDASTDGTKSKIQFYQNKYPKLIKVIYQERNQYSIGHRAFMSIMPMAKGKYIALCEGDDYWTDVNKLQIQHSYLETHPEIVVSSHDAIVINESGKTIQKSKLLDEYKCDFTGEDLILGNAWLLTLGCVFRNVPTDIAFERGRVDNGDNFLMALLGFYGGSHYHGEIAPAIYRVHAGGVWSTLSENDALESKLNTWFWMYKYFKRTNKTKYADYYWSKYYKTLLLRIKLKDLFRALVVRSLYLREIKRILYSLITKYQIADE